MKQNHTVSGRPKSKVNPKGLCSGCGAKIRGRQRNALYCKTCGLVKEYLLKFVWACIDRFKKKNPDYIFSMKLKITMRKKR